MNILLIAWLLFVLNFLYGLLVGIGLVERGRWRKLHHFLYLLTMLGIVAAIVSIVVGSGEIPPAPIAMALLLLGVSRTHGGSRAHTVYAVVCLALYSALVFWM